MAFIKDMTGGDNAIYSIYVSYYGDESVNDGNIAGEIIRLHEYGKDSGKSVFPSFATGGLCGAPRYLRDRTGISARNGLNLESEDDYSWPDPDGDMLELSRSFPGTMFRLHAECRSGRAVDAYFKDGESCALDTADAENGSRSRSGIFFGKRGKKKDRAATFRLSDDTLRRLDDYSSRTGVSKSFIADAAIAAYLIDKDSHEGSAGNGK